MAQDTSVYAGIVKFDKQPDGTIIVYGKATDDSLDSDAQICDPAWLKTAMPEWFKYGNIREQHSSIAAGVATEYENKGSEHWITAHVVDPSSAKKVEAGVLKGFSIGIRGARVAKDNKAIGGRIVDGTIVEVSLVDRPANPSCTLVMAKAMGADVVQVEELTVKYNENQERDDRGRFAGGGGGESGGSDSNPVGKAKDALDALREHIKNSDVSNSAKKEALGYIKGGERELELAQMYQEQDDMINFKARLKGASNMAVRAESLASLRAYTTGLDHLGNLTAEYTGENSTPANIGSQAIDAIVAEHFGKSDEADVVKYNEEQERDDHGRFAGGGGSGEGNIVSNSGHDFGTPSEPNLEAITEAAESHYADAEGIMSDVQAAFQATDPGTANVVELSAAKNQINLGMKELQRAAETTSVADAAYYHDMASHNFENASRHLDFAGETDSGMQSRNLAQEIKDTGLALERLQKSIIADLVKTASQEQIAMAKTIIEKAAQFADGDISKFDQASFDMARRGLAGLIAVEAAEMAEGSDETDSLACLLAAIHALFEFHQDEAADGETMEVEGGYGDTDVDSKLRIELADGKVCEDCGKEPCQCDDAEAEKAEDENGDSLCKECGKDMKECKCAEGGYSAEEKAAKKAAKRNKKNSELRELIMEVVKTVLTTPEGGEEMVTKAAEAERIEALESELAQVKALAAPTGPKRMAQSVSAENSVTKSLAAQYRAKANSTLDKTLAAGYLKMAADLEKTESN